MASYEHTTTFQSNLNWGETFKMTVKAPAIADRIFKTWDDANKYIHDRGNSAIAGLNLSVIDDSDRNGVYFIDSIRRSEGYVDDFGNVYHAGEKELVMVQLASGGGKFNYSGIQIGTGEQMNVWTGTLEEFNQLTPDEHTVYFIDGGGYTKKKNFFYFENTSDAPVSVNINRVGVNAPIITPEFSTDTETWVDYGSTESRVDFTVPAKSKLFMRCKCNGWGYGSSHYNKFYFTEKLDIGGNILSLLYGEDYEDGIKDIPQGTTSYTFCCIFNAAAVEDASNLVIDFNTTPEYALMGTFSDCTSLVDAPTPTTKTLNRRCYAYMFSNCTSLVDAPALPVVNLSDFCYFNMFYNCTSLVNAPELPATNLGIYCYSNMFNGCISLVNAPELPAKTMSVGAYTSMFYNCTSLVNAPELPATDLAQYCYGHMFHGCTSLKKTPVLYVPAGAEGCYDGMFNGDSNLTYIINTNEDYVSNHYDGWVYGVASSGVFVKAPTAEWGRGVSGIPEGWIVVNDGQMRGDIMWYKTNDGNIMSPNASKFADTAGNPVSIVSNVIDENGIGVINFSAPVGRITGSAFNRKSNLVEVWLPYTVVDTGQGTFNDCTNLKMIWIWENVEVIGATFNGLTSLQKVYVHATEPPVLSVNQANNLKNYGASVYVPHESLLLYIEADNWTTIADQIVGM